MGYEAVLEVVGESGGDSGKNGEEVRLEGADGAFVDVTTMDIRGHELEFRPPLLCNVELVVCTSFVVKDLDVDTMAGFSDSGHDSICGSKAVAVVAGFKWPHKDDIGVQMV